MTEWRVGVIICNYNIWWRTVFTLHGQMSDISSVHYIHILASPRSDVWSIFGNVTTKRIIVDRDNWLENIASVNFLLAMIMAGMHGNILFLSESCILGIITSIYSESGLWCVGTLWHERGSGIQGNDVMGAAIITRDIPSLRAATNGEINCITNWPQFRFIIGHICMEPQWMIMTWLWPGLAQCPVIVTNVPLTMSNVQCESFTMINLDGG